MAGSTTQERDAQNKATLIPLMVLGVSALFACLLFFYFAVTGTVSSSSVANFVGTLFGV